MSVAVPVFAPLAGPHPLAPLGQFLTPVPRLMPARKHIMRLVDEIAYCDQRGRVWRVPVDWHLDGCSIPWWATWRWDRWDRRYLRSAGVHDLGFCAQFLSFAECNAMFGECLRSEKWPSARLFTWAVGTPCGWVSYSRTPNLPENDIFVEVLKAKWESRGGPELWTPQTEPKLAA